MKSNKRILSVSFFIPVLITIFYFACRHMAPFGSSSILTVDLGQQYIDFFAYFRETILHNPRGIFYTFAQGLGGNMFGTWAYYLMSPLNWLLLFFPTQQLPSAILLLTVLQYGLAGLSSAYLLLQLKQMDNRYIPAFSTCYSLMGWMVANQLNIIWLDAIIILPLVFLGVIRLIVYQKAATYILWLTLILIINYYFAYMIAIFITLMVWFINFNHSNNRQQFWLTEWRWFKASLISGALAAFNLIPTYLSLRNSKMNYSTNLFHFKVEYNPLQFFGKFFNGSFDFKQLPSGTPNLFVASFILILVGYFYFSNSITLRLKLSHLAITLFMFVSMWFAPLDLLWHAGQMPVWYPYRFSFVFSFWLIITAYYTWSIILQNQLEKGALIKTLIVAVIIIAAIGLIIKQLEYLTIPNYLIGIGYFILTAILLVILAKQSLYQAKYLPLLVVSLVTVEMTINFVNSLNNLSYLNSNEYNSYAQMVQKQARLLQSNDSSFYRIGSTFARTKNDPFTGNYNGTSLFSSTLDSKTSRFYANMGNPDGDAFVTYTNGTTFTDSLLGIKYYWSQSPATKINGKLIKSPLSTISYRPDIAANYSKINQNGLVTTSKNNNALPLMFLTTQKTTINQASKNDPIDYQNHLYQIMTGRQQNILTSQSITNFKYQNLHSISTLDDAILQKSELLKPAQLSFNITTKPHHSYYLTLGSNLSTKDLSIYVNNKKVTQYPDYRHAVVLNIASTKQAQLVKVTLKPKKNNVWLQDMNLYQLNNQQLAQSMQKIKHQNIKITTVKNNQIMSKVNVNQVRQTLLTTIPYDKGWRIKVDGKKVNASAWANMFTKISLPKGKHQISFTYYPNGLIIGIWISCLSGVGLILFKKFID